MRRVLWAFLALSTTVAIAACAAHDPAPLTADHILQRMEDALYRDDVVPVIRETAVAVEGDWERPWFSSEATFGPGGDAGRITVTRPEELELDVFEEIEILAIAGMAYSRTPHEDLVEGGPDTKLLGSCAPEASSVLRRWVVCGTNIFTPNLTGSLVVTEGVTFGGREAVNLSWSESDRPDVSGTITTTVFFDARSYFPLGYIRDFDGGGTGQTAQFRASWDVTHVPGDSLPSDYFDPEAFGYIPPDERDRHELDSATVGPVYWLGISVSVAGLPELSIGWVRVDPGVHHERGAWVGIDYGPDGQGGRVELEMWEPGGWDEFLRLLASHDSTFADGCYETELRTEGGVEVEILRFRYGDRTTAAPPTTAPTPGDTCPERPLDWTMAVVRFPDGTVTLNAPISMSARPAGGDYTGADVLVELAGQLRLREKGE